MATGAAENPYLGVGLYTIGDAARILDDSKSRVRGWLRGYKATTTGGLRQYRSYINRDLPEFEEQSVLTFADLIELKFIQMFRDKGVSPKTIIRVYDLLSERYKTNHPFTVRRIQTDGKNLLDLLGESKSGPIYEDVMRAQTVLGRIAQPFFLKLKYHRDIASEYWPIGVERRVVIAPEYAFGSPVESKSAVPTLVLYKGHEAGEPVEALADWYDVEPEGVSDAIAYERRLAA
jgi:uncharacterized protein (DUF433 family)